MLFSNFISLLDSNTLLYLSKITRWRGRQQSRSYHQVFLRFMFTDSLDVWTLSQLR